MNAPLLVAGDTKPTRLTYKNGDDVIDITGYQFRIKFGYSTPVTRAGAVVDAINGVFEFQWQAGDLQGGTFPVEILVTDAAGKELTHKLGGVTIATRIA